jgi:hypothetical protein
VGVYQNKINNASFFNNKKKTSSISKMYFVPIVAIGKNNEYSNREINSDFE